mmetsp:Transcript_2451/g.3748  ORF Transcript_2451/g.3748 Transcript_2451/m.3748 type:complete len:80 (-) Transcript_2451:135-374(-)
MLSKMGGRMMHYYSEELVDLLLEDFLEETAVELQNIEEKERSSQKFSEGKDLAENLLNHINEFQSEQHLVEMRWTNAEI